MTDAPSPRRRARRRATARQGPPAPRPDEPPMSASTSPPRTDPSPRTDPPPRRDPPPRKTKGPQPEAKRRAGRAAQGRRPDHDLAGPGASQVGPTGAMRARDLNRPTADDLAEAEAELVIVRRNWAPADEQHGHSGPERPPRRRRS